MNPATKTTFGELYQNTLQKKRFCQEHEYEYFSIWESEWIRGKNSIIKLQQKFKNIRGANFERSKTSLVCDVNLILEYHRTLP